MLKTNMITQNLLRSVIGRTARRPDADRIPPVGDPWSHPALGRMSLDQLADLPFNRSRAPEGD